MAIIKGFKSTDVWHAFILNSFATAMAVIAALFFKDFWDQKDQKDRAPINKRRVIVVFITTFVAAFLAYTALHVVFGFGGGMLVQT